MDVFGVGQCHLDGLEFLSHLLASKRYRRVLWLNMREEPVVFLGGQVRSHLIASGEIASGEIESGEIASGRSSRGVWSFGMIATDCL